MGCVCNFARVSDLEQAIASLLDLVLKCLWSSCVSMSSSCKAVCCSALQSTLVGVMTEITFQLVRWRYLLLFVMQDKSQHSMSSVQCALGNPSGIHLMLDECWVPCIYRDVKFTQSTYIPIFILILFFILIYLIEVTILLHYSFTALSWRHLERMLQYISLSPPCAEQGRIHVLVREKKIIKNKAYFSIKHPLHGLKHPLHSYSMLLCSVLASDYV